MRKRSGHDAGFERLYEEHKEAVRGYCLRRAEPSVADDVVSQTFEIAWRRRDEVRKPSRAWLIGIARKVLANRRRSDRRHLDLVARLAEEPPLGFEEERPPIVAALSRLSAVDQETLLLAAWDGLSSPEAARVLGCTPVAFRLRLLRARRRLADELGNLERRPTVTFDHDGTAVRAGETQP
jgi:RNA polymerase sigma-70 factor (ECF subfamily)